MIQKILSSAVSELGMNRSGFLNSIPAIYQCTGFCEFGYSLNFFQYVN